MKNSFSSLIYRYFKCLCVLVLVAMFLCGPSALASQYTFPIYPSEKMLPDGLAGALYSQISQKFRYQGNWTYCDFYYDELARSLGLQPERDLERAKAQLEPAFQKLHKDYYLDGDKWFNPAQLLPRDRRTGRWQVRYYPGVRFTHNQLLELWYEAMNPDNSAVTAILNNRSILFDDSKAFASQRAYAEPILLKALQCAREMGVPRDIVACLCNLGCFNYLGANFHEADRNFHEAVEIVRSTTTKSSPALAPIIDLEALSARALKEFPRAEKLYAESLQIRTSIAGYYKPDVAINLMNFGCMYADWSYEDNPPSIKLKYSKRAQDLFQRADEIINPPSSVREFTRLRDEALKYSKLAYQAYQQNDPETGWHYRDRARELTKQSEQFQKKHELVNSTDRPDVVPNSIDLSHGLSRPYTLTMTTNSGSDKLEQMVRFAQSISKKCEPIPQPPPPDPQGLAIILGNWSIPTDVLDVAVTKTMHRKEKVLEGELDVVEKREEKKSPVENVTIYLCPYPENPNEILSQILNFGTERGLAWAGLGDLGTTHGWPANHIQAEQLQSILDEAARRLSNSTTQMRTITTTTDKNGDYKFDGIPKGDYLLYASVCTKKECLIWLIPPKKIKVRRVEQFRYDFIKTTGMKLWEDGHPAAPATPAQYFEGSAAKSEALENANSTTRK